MKNFEELNEAAQFAKRDWVIGQVENTELTHDEIEAEFKKKYPTKADAKLFSKVVDSLV